jgi:hypothetical protein
MQIIFDMVVVGNAVAKLQMLIVIDDDFRQRWMTEALIGAQRNSHIDSKFQNEEIIGRYFYLSDRKQRRESWHFCTDPKLGDFLRDCSFGDFFKVIVDYGEILIAESRFAKIGIDIVSFGS